MEGHAWHEEWSHCIQLVASGVERASRIALSKIREVPSDIKCGKAQKNVLGAMLHGLFYFLQVHIRWI